MSEQRQREERVNCFMALDRVRLGENGAKLVRIGKAPIAAVYSACVFC